MASRCFRRGIFRILAIAMALNGMSYFCWAIVLNQIDTFNSGTVENWGIARGATPIGILMNDGASGMPGDHALLMDTQIWAGQQGRLVVNNETQWKGNWTATGVAQVSMDVRNPNDFMLSMRLGIGGPDNIGGSGSGDAFISKQVIPVPADDLWHTITFDVLASDFQFLSQMYQNVAGALADVTHFRILHTKQEGDYNGNGTVDAADYVVWRDTIGMTVTEGTGADGSGPEGQPDGVINNFDYEHWRSLYGDSVREFIGAVVDGKFHLDNIRALPAAGGSSVVLFATVPEPSSLLAISIWLCLALMSFRRQK